MFVSTSKRQGRRKSGPIGTLPCSEPVRKSKILDVFLPQRWQERPAKLFLVTTGKRYGDTTQLQLNNRYPTCER